MQRVRALRDGNDIQRPRIAGTRGVVIKVCHGQRHPLGEGELAYVSSKGYVRMDQNIRIDSLILESGRFDIGSVSDSTTVTTTFLDWQGARDISPANARGALVIVSHPDNAFSRLDPGQFNNQQYWSTHIHLQGYARLEWLSGIINSRAGKKYINLHIGDLAIFDIDDTADKLWGYELNEGMAVSYVRIINEGAIFKNGNQTKAYIAGCLENKGNGYISSDGGIIVTQHDAICN